MTVRDSFGINWKDFCSYLNDNVNAKLSPRKLEWVSVGDNLDGLTVHTDGAVVHDLHIGLEGSEHRVVFQQVRGLCNDEFKVINSDSLLF